MLVLCDFDGTISATDITNIVWDEFGIPNWRDKLLPPYRAGKTTTLDLMSEGWRAIAVSEAQLLDYVRPLVKLREGFAELREFCAQRRWEFYVVSCGLEWYLRAFLPADIRYVCYKASFNQGWDVTLPSDCTLPAGVDFKVFQMERLRQKHPGEEIVFIGDGRNDFPIARKADRAFAVKGSTLAALCAEHGIACPEFTTFHEVMQQL